MAVKYPIYICPGSWLLVVVLLLVKSHTHLFLQEVPSLEGWDRGSEEVGASTGSSRNNILGKTSNSTTEEHFTVKSRCYQMLAFGCQEACAGNKCSGHSHKVGLK
ncbi:unnamed protein product [Ostreobium quekettii]|uniref:Uncharacterized protein n=1 Tax=Ostreobium quekettii TaxID=121088 RepID=A0A8S1JBX6_9CHLO|nr:unnamed protein product [Ostreobium quekettii]